MDRKKIIALAAWMLAVPVSFGAESGTALTETKLKPDGSHAAALLLKNGMRIPGIITLAPKARMSFKFPAVTGRPVLRFQVRTEGDTGWNTMLNLSVNGKPLKMQKADGRARLLNRGLIFSAKSWKNQNMGTDSVCTVFFSRSFTMSRTSVSYAGLCVLG